MPSNSEKGGPLRGIGIGMIIGSTFMWIMGHVYCVCH